MRLRRNHFHNQWVTATGAYNQTCLGGLCQVNYS
jgi:hypothetical protein